MIGYLISENLMLLLFKVKGDGNDGEPDALEKLEMEKRPKIGWN